MFGVGRTRDALLSMARDLGIDWAQVDLTDAAAVERLVPTVLDRYGRVDVLVNCAGVGGGHSVLTDAGEVRRMIAVNLEAPIALMRRIVPHMLERRSGAIVNVGSVAGEVGVSGVYSATKFGLRGVTDSVRRELRGTGVGVSLIEPSYIATPMTAHRSAPMPGPEIVADAILAAIARPVRRMTVPRRVGVVRYVEALVPRVFDGRYTDR